MSTSRVRVVVRVSPRPALARLATLKERLDALR